MSTFCRGVGPTGEPCDCEEFSPPKEGELLKCIECMHGKSKHPPRQTTLVEPSRQPSSQSATSKTSVMQLFNSMTSSKNVKADLTATLSQARAESLRGYTRPSRTHHSSTSHDQGPTKANHSQAITGKGKAKELLVRVADVAVLATAEFNVELVSVVYVHADMLSLLGGRGTAGKDSPRESLDGHATTFRLCKDRNDGWHT
jgi:hypothetical protein